MSARRTTKAKLDYALLLVVVVLVIFGLIMIYSATITWDDPNDLVKKQSLWALLGFACLAIVARVDHRRLRHWAVLIMGSALALLVAVLLTPQGDSGARSWFRDGSVQPSEVAKLAFVIYIAAWLDSKGDKIREVTYGLLPFSVLLAVVAGLIVAEPDLGTAILVMMTAGAMFFFAGAEVTQILTAMALGLPLVGYLVVRNERWVERVLVFLDPTRDPQGAGFHTRGILDALKAGGLTGRGLGEGAQKLLMPYVHHTDTIFSVVGEVLGLIGCVLLIGLFMFVAYRGLVVSFRAQDRFGTLLAVGVTGWIAFQAVVHIAGNSGAMPFTGITLPFVSYGGSSLVTTLAGVGVLLSISRSEKRGKPKGGATFAFRRRDRRPRLSRTSRR